MPRGERPDVMAIYPSWWGELPLWFGRRIAEVPVHENVICGGPSKVIYAAEWDALDGSARPFGRAARERIVDELDFADLLSEERHGYRLSQPRVGHVEMKVLDPPGRPEVALWDAGRIVPSPVVESFELRGFAPSSPVRLLLRAAPFAPASFTVVAQGQRVGKVDLKPGDTWQEYAVALPLAAVPTTISVRFEGIDGTRVLYHLWAVQAP